MSRKRKAPKKIPITDPVYKSAIIPKLINSIMYDGKKTVAEKIIYDAIDKIKSKSKEEPMKIFNAAEHLCDDIKCYGMVNGKILYRDNDHLSLEGGKLISNELIKLLNLKE